VDERSIRPQQKLFWCWTAYINMILKLWEIRNVTQEEFAEKVCGIDRYGHACNCGSSSTDISRSLNFRGYDQSGMPFRVNTPLIESSPETTIIFYELLTPRPVLVAYRIPNSTLGHAVIIMGCEYYYEDGMYYITKLVIRDPSPDFVNIISQGRKEITGNDVAFFLRSIYAHWYVQ
jgi:hypothetical protein